MATSSFDKNFIITDKKAIEELLADMDKPLKVRICKRDLDAESERGISLLKQVLHSTPFPTKP